VSTRTRSLPVLRSTSAVAVLAAVLLAGCAGAPDRSATTAGPGTTSSAPTTTSAPPSTTSPAPTTTAAPPTTTAPPATTAPPTTTPPTTTPPTTTPPAPAPTTTTLGQGDSGAEVLALQQRLRDLGYWLGEPDGTYGLLTTQAVLALQGVAGIDRDGRTGPQTRAALEAGTRYQPRSASGAVTEIDRDQGVIAFVRDGAVELVLHTSTGTFETYTSGGRELVADTPAGEYAVTWAHSDGWREGQLGRLYRPRYFHPDGIAVHGYTSVPAFPASHGCARVTVAAMDMIWARDLMPKGSAVVVL
jgi:peptidoglycan hydrolase-like protein with peptidoglycan-binding domain